MNSVDLSHFLAHKVWFGAVATTMDLTNFTLPSGHLVSTIHGQRAFVPSPLPPTINLSPIQQLISEADQKLGELRGIGRYLPNPYLLIRPLQRKEAIASSNIEGTYTSLPELLLFESGLEEYPKSVDTREVYNYTVALKNGIETLKNLPVSIRLVQQLHKDLLRGLPAHRSSVAQPGVFRGDQNFIGRTKDITKSRFNPPPPPTHLHCMHELEIFINDESMYNLPLLVFLAMVHYQFETIHPFPDGNGRVGRLLIPIIIQSRQSLDQPLLYMSQFFEDNKDEYVDLMLGVSQASRWSDWVSFFMKGVVETCEKTIQTIKKVRDLHEEYLQRCQQARSSALLAKITNFLFETLYITVPMVREITGTSYTAAQHNVTKLVEYGILSPRSSISRPRYYFANELISLFEA